MKRHQALKCWPRASHLSAQCDSRRRDLDPSVILTCGPISQFARLKRSSQSIASASAPVTRDEASSDELSESDRGAIGRRRLFCIHGRVQIHTPHMIIIWKSIIDADFWIWFQDSGGDECRRLRPKPHLPHPRSESRTKVNKFFYFC